MDVILAAPRGFCAGVERAIEIVEISLVRFGPPVYVKHQIVHNPYVVSSLEKKGAVTVEDIEQIPEGSLVVFSAHGSPPEDYAKAETRKLKVIDATCPLVTKVHNEAIKYDSDESKIVLVGHRGHQEVRGTMGQTEMILVDDSEGVNLPQWDRDTRVVLLTQTTLSVDDTAKTIKKIQSKFHNTVVRNDLCYATTNRQDAVKKLAKLVDIVLVIGSQNSSNCNRLMEVARGLGVKAYLINGAEELNDSWLCGVDKVGITSGASTPEVLVNNVILKLKPDDVTTIEGVEEKVRFILPKILLRDKEAFKRG